MRGNMKEWKFLELSQIVPMSMIFLLLVAALALFPVAAAADEAMEARHLAERAQLTLETFARAPEMEAFRNLVTSARGVFIAPQILKGAFIVGAAGGSGVFVARDRLREQWAGPAFYTIGEVSFGFQIGGSASEVVLLAMTDRGVNALLESSIKLGADAGVAVGPVGMGAAASTANLSADILSFSRSKGLYGGISLDGAIVKTRNGWNNAYYGAITTPADIFIKRTAYNPHAAGLIDTVSILSGTTRPPAPAAGTPTAEEEPSP
jgi:SH3 domain-containing YSC84-like protein 1